MPEERVAAPFHGFRFRVDFFADPLPGHAQQPAGGQQQAPSSETGTAITPAMCEGAFSEISGLEATLEPVSISEGGRNWGQHQRVGRVTFSTVILKRGMTSTRHLWAWFSHVNRNAMYKHRLNVVITLMDYSGTAEDPKDLLSWTLSRALPVKMKLADLNAAGQELAIEELHLVHEGIAERPVDEQGG